METSHTPPPVAVSVPRPLTPDKVRQVRAHIAAVHDHIRQRGVDPTRLPDPVKELIKARGAGGWE